MEQQFSVQLLYRHSVDQYELQCLWTRRHNSRPSSRDWAMFHSSHTHRSECSHLTDSFHTVESFSLIDMLQAMGSLNRFQKWIPQRIQQCSKFIEAFCSSPYDSSQTTIQVQFRHLRTDQFKEHFRFDSCLFCFFDVFHQTSESIDGFVK